ncbi:MAG: tail fiber domain-containing protein [Burkholderiales bacterium]|nr:tail fiber domain-containing protein [Burkholderiales bacterium]
MKSTETKDQPIAIDADGKQMCKPGKAAYARPVLRLYGSLSTLTRGGMGSGNDGGPAGRNKMSDRNTKENIVRVGEHPLGIGLYLFDYKPGYRETDENHRQFGVMADEVEAVLPQAVSVHADGYKMVDYELLGIDLALQ